MNDPRETIEQVRRQRQALADFKTWWMAKYQAKPFGGRRCLEKLTNPRHRCNRYRCRERGGDPSRFYSGVLDHAEWFRDVDGRFIVTGHPYGLGGLPEFRAWAAGVGLAVTVDADPSWYHENTHLVIVAGEVPTQ